MDSAFGIDHGEIEKGLKDVAQTARLHGRGFKQGAKLGRLHRKKALAEAGYPAGFVATQKEAFRAGKSGSGKTWASGRKAAGSAAKKRTMNDIKLISQGQKPPKYNFLNDPGRGDAMNARFSRRLSSGG